MIVNFEKISERTWRLHCGSGYTAMWNTADFVRRQLKDNYNISAEIERAYSSGSGYMSDHQIVVKFDNDADEAEFMLKVSGNDIKITFSMN